MFTSAKTWLIFLGINLAAYGLGMLFQVHDQIQYFYFVSGTLFMTIPLAMIIFRCNAGGWEPKLSLCGKIIIWASVPGGAIVFLTGYYRVGMSMNEALRRSIINLDNQWMIGLEIFVFLSIATLILTLSLWDRSIWTASETYLLLNKEEGVLYPGQGLRYRLFHRNPKTVSLPSAFKIRAALTMSGVSYISEAYAATDFEQARTRGVSKIDLQNLEKEACKWGQETLPKILLDLKFSEILNALDSKQILATTDIQGIPINLRLWQIAPSWLAQS